MIPSPPIPNDKNYHLEKHSRKQISVTPSKARFEKKNYSLTSDNFFV